MRISDWSSDVCSSDLAVGGDDRMTDSKADPEAIFFRGEKAMKYLGKILRWNARAAIAERKIYRIILFDPCREQNFAVCDLLALHSLKRVYEHVHYHLLQQIGRAPCRARVCQSV